MLNLCVNHSVLSFFSVLCENLLLEKCVKKFVCNYRFLCANFIDAPKRAFFDAEDVVLATYVNQCKAEAQEITIARAIELGHSAGLVSAVAGSTALLFQAAADGLHGLERDKAVVEKWKRYVVELVLLL